MENSSQVPEISGYDVLYDRMDGNDIAGSSESETRTIYNTKRTDIPVEKTWSWSDSDQNKGISSWSATFKLQYREVYESGTPDNEQNVQSLWGYVYDGDNVKEITITNGDQINTGSNTFANLPTHKIHDNGSIYRLVYAVEEAEYTINYTDGTHKIWSRDTGGAFEEHYSPIYEEDAVKS